MAVNGIELAVGQHWKTHGGEEVVVVNNNGHRTYPWVLSSLCSVTNYGNVWEDSIGMDDLVVLVQDEHGFIPWNGGECPVEYGVKIEYKMKNDPAKVYEGFPDGLRWEHFDLGGDIIAYRVVEQEVKPAKVDAEGEQKKGVVVETTTEAKEEPKYTVDEVFTALEKISLQFEHWDYYSDVVNHLAKTQDPDYKLYLYLKAKFE